MARNEEKASAVINRFLTQKDAIEKGTWDTEVRRPRFAHEVENVKDAERWRRHVIKEITGKISEIQNAGLGEHRIRDLNDEINKLLRVKGHWEDQIVKLGGTDYKAQSKTFDAFGQEIEGQGGYKYFGAAKDLPGVRELFEQRDLPDAPRRTRAMLLKNIQPDYYGWRDEEDGLLLLAEQEAEMHMQIEAKKNWEADTTNLLEERKRKALEIEPKELMRSYVSLPTKEDIDDMILAKKKQAIMDKYLSKDEQKEQEQTAKLVKGDDE